MNNKYKQIISLYLRNPSFILISGIFLLSAIISKVFYLVGQPYFAEDVATILFVGTLWLCFHVGLILKRQFANHRASLLPNYKNPHLLCASMIYLLFIIIAIVWNYGLIPLFTITPHGLQGVYVLCLLVALLITYLGFLSVGRAFIYGYVLLLVLAVKAMTIISILDGSPYLKYIIAILCLIFLFSFKSRLLNIKEENFEYAYILSWPPKSFIVNQLKASQLTASLFSPVLSFLGVKERELSIRPYPREQGLLARAIHWNCTESIDIKWICFFLVLASPIYIIILSSHSAIESFFRNAYSNFLLLAMTPILMTIGSHYQKMGYWGYDLLKPIRKNRYIKEKGIILIVHLLLYWLVFSICFAILPSLIFQSEVFVEKKYWGFIVLTGTFAFLVLSWLLLLSSSSKPKIVILNGIILCNIILFQFYFVATFSFETILSLNVICFLGGMFLLKKAYNAWCQKEFD